MIHVLVGDLANQEAEGVLRPVRSDLSPLNAAARDLLLAAGGGVADRLEQLESIPMGGAVMTPGGDLPAGFIIHVVTASDDEPETAHTVQRALRNGLRRAADWGLASLALPPLGLGVGNLAPEDAARAMVEILVDHLDEGQPPLDFTIVASSAYEMEIFGHLVEELTRDRFPMRN